MNLLNLYITSLRGNVFVLLLAVAICADMIFGSLRAAKEHKWNSSMGIDGGIRKIGMVAGVLVLTAADMLLPLNLIGWVSDDITKILASAGIVKLGITELFAILFILYEATSVLKNMTICGLPVPDAAVKWLQNQTEETHALDSKEE